ncbi:MAG: hypothetical protein HY731_02425 [Candidatus Tectomicrobia bacterium]|nr:hypothetical protein [Candidatus Tectomicrobia bacterium]
MQSRWKGILSLLAFLLAGCTRPLPHPVQLSPTFPPQTVMENGNYAEFLDENQRMLEKCVGETGCDVAIFNLGFVYAYPQSPYRDPAKALDYFDKLFKEYPQSFWIFQGQAWVAFINENVTLEKARRQLQIDLRTREATIRRLQGQLNRLREIDIEIQKKEQELLR